MARVKTAGRRARLLAELQDAVRQMSTVTIMMHGAIAGQLGLGATDHKYADMLHRAGPMTASEFAAVTGLTTGAITGVVDRLEAAGLARRERDPGDRRRVIVVPAHDPAMRARMETAFAPLADAFRESLAGYTDDELALILGFLRRSIAVSTAHAERVRAARDS